MFGSRDRMLAVGHLARGTYRDTNTRFRVYGFLLYMLCRHAMLVDQTSESVVVPLNTALGSSGKLELANSMWWRIDTRRD